MEHSQEYADIKHLHDDYTFHVHAGLDRHGDAEITAIAVSVKPDASITGIQSSIEIPITLIRHYAEVMLNSPWSTESLISTMVTEDTELPTKGRRSAPDRLLKVAWLHRHAERTNKTPSSVIARHFGITNKVTVSKWVTECREKGYLPPRSKSAKTAEPASDANPATTTEQLEEQIFRNRLEKIADRGGAMGELAASLHQELDAASTEPHAHVVFNEKELRSLIPPLQLESTAPLRRSALLLVVHACKGYERTFNSLAVSHRKRPADEIAEVLAAAAKRCQVIFTEEALAKQAITIRERRTARFRVDPELLTPEGFPAPAEWDPAPSDGDADTYGDVECPCGCGG
ncbi:hypothetical protein [Streptomyces sp. AB3(2024)]|uniref:hypothetical protein n=1 Tax=Streptomyces sp. AB3(2024) TaxID=3317321 RepID=UPI0035A33472